MATTIAVYNKDGKCVGRCDAKCHGAKSPSCKCICFGMNHGCPTNKAIENTQIWYEHWIKRWKEEHPEEADELRFEVPVYEELTQLSIIPDMTFKVLRVS